MRMRTANNVLQRNWVINQSWEAAMLHDTRHAPAIMEVRRSIGCYGCLSGRVEEHSAAIHAYMEAFLEGTPTWACLPKGLWPMTWRFALGDCIGTWAGVYSRAMMIGIHAVLVQL